MPKILQQLPLTCCAAEWSQGKKWSERLTVVPAEVPDDAPEPPSSSQRSPLSAEGKGPGRDHEWPTQGFKSPPSDAVGSCHSLVSLHAPKRDPTPPCA